MYVEASDGSGVKPLRFDEASGALMSEVIVDLASDPATLIGMVGT